MKTKLNNYKKEVIKRFDLFGIPIEFNVHGHGESYKTTYGLVVSIVVYLIYLGYMKNIVSSIFDGSNTQILQYKINNKEL